MKILQLLFIILLGLGSYAQKADLVTDRPDQTESSVAVPVGALQIETGFMQIDNTAFSSTVYNTTLLRYGLFENTELRLGAGFETYEDLAIETEGLAPIMLGFKSRIKEESGFIPEMAVMLELTMPYFGSDDFAPNTTDAKFLASFAHTLSDRMSLGYNLGSVWSNETINQNWVYSAALGYSLLDKVGLFAEFYGGKADRFKPDNAADFGVTWLIVENIQLDLSYGIGLMDLSANDSFLSFGLSMRFFK